MSCKHSFTHWIQYKNKFNWSGTLVLDDEVVNNLDHCSKKIGVCSKGIETRMKRVCRKCGKEEDILLIRVFV